MNRPNPRTEILRALKKAQSPLDLSNILQTVWKTCYRRHWRGWQGPWADCPRIVQRHLCHLIRSGRVVRHGGGRYALRESWPLVEESLASVATYEIPGRGLYKLLDKPDTRRIWDEARLFGKRVMIDGVIWKVFGCEVSGRGRRCTSLTFNPRCPSKKCVAATNKCASEFGDKRHSLWRPFVTLPVRRRLLQIAFRYL